MPLPTLYSKDSVDNLLADKLDLAGGTMTGGLTLSATGIIFSDSTTMTTAPAGGTLAADQLTAGVVATNPAAGPTTAGDVLQYDGTDLIWAAGGGGGGLTISTLSNGATSTLNATAPTTGQALTYDGTDLIWAAGGGGGGLTISTLSNGATSTLNATAPTTGQALTYDGTDLVWATAGGGVAWGAITGTLSSQTDLQTALDAKLPVKSVNAQTSGYTLVSSDANNIVHLTGMTNVITVPQDSTYSFTIGTVIIIASDNSGAGIVPEVTSGGGGPVPSINNQSTNVSIGFGLTLVKVSSDLWVAF